jgi:hypothetical protein
VDDKPVLGDHFVFSWDSVEREGRDEICGSFHSIFGGTMWITHRKSSVGSTLLGNPTSSSHTTRNTSSDSSFTLPAPQVRQGNLQ